mgnify:CR=1 FL=1
MTQFTKSFLWRFILDIILLGIFVRLLQSVILAILSRSMETYDDVDYVYDKYAYNNIKHINEGKNMKAIKTIYNNCGWFLLVLIFGNILLNFFAPNSLIGQENINLVCLFLKIKAISAIVLAFFMIMFMIKSALMKKVTV